MTADPPNSPPFPPSAQPPSPPPILERLISEVAEGEGGPRAPKLGPGDSWVAWCVQDRHPVLQGRVEVRWEALDGQGEGEERRWVPVLRNVAVRRDDRLLLLHPVGWDEPIVVGVVDGYRRRPEPGPEEGPTLALRADEALTILGAEGSPLIRVRQTEKGPEVRLLESTARMHLPEDLEISARSVKLQAREGEVRIEAHDDVVVRGEMIKLN